MLIVSFEKKGSSHLNTFFNTNYYRFILNGKTDNYFLIEFLFKLGIHPGAAPLISPNNFWLIMTLKSGRGCSWPLFKSQILWAKLFIKLRGQAHFKMKAIDDT